MTTSRRLMPAYRTVAQVWLTACLLLAVLLAGLRVWRDLQSSRPPGVRDLGEALYASYPGWSRQEVDRLLIETWPARTFAYEPFTQFREVPRQGSYVNVSPAGFRHSVKQGPWPPDPTHFNVFVFGGSITFGYGVRDAETVASRLQEHWRTPDGFATVSVYNFGRAYYFSAQERTLFERLLWEGHVPNAAIFIDGAAEFSQAQRPRFTTQLTLFMEGKLSGFRPAIATLLHLGSAEPLVAPGPRPRREAVFEGYARNKRLTEAVARDSGVATVFVWAPTPGYHYDRRYHPFSDRVDARSPAYEAMWAQLERQPLGENFIWAADIQAAVAASLYIDGVHYNPRGCDLLGAYVAETIEGRGLASKVRAPASVAPDVAHAKK